jgi:hypothetical protein
MGHDLHTHSNAKAAFQCALVVNHAPVADRDFGADQDLMATLEAMADGGVGVDDRSGTNDGVIADPQRTGVTQITITEHNAHVDLAVLADLIVRVTFDQPSPSQTGSRF